MPKLVRVMLIAVFCLGIATVSFAQQLNVGCVDIIEVFNNYRKTQDLEADLSKKAADYTKKRDAQIEEIKKLRDKIAILSDQAKEKKQKELEKKADDLRQFESQNVRDIQRERDATRREILEEIEKYIQGYAKDKGYDLILYRNIVIFNRSGMDLTEEILSGLNKQYKRR